MPARRRRSNVLASRRRFDHIDGCEGAAYLGFMALLPIITAPDPRLKIKATPVAQVDPKVRRLMDDMLETMYHSIGIGLAAPQVGATQRVLVVDVAREGEPPQPMRIANPEILWHSEETMMANEGCLSLPKHYADVAHPKALRLRYIDY